MECAGTAKRRRRFQNAVGDSQSGVALRLPPQSKTRSGWRRFMAPMCVQFCRSRLPLKPLSRVVLRHTQSRRWRVLLGAFCFRKPQKRGCVADQPQQIGSCCDWLSAQSRFVSWKVPTILKSCMVVMNPVGRRCGAASGMRSHRWKFGLPPWWPSARTTALPELGKNKTCRHGNPLEVSGKLKLAIAFGSEPAGNLGAEARIIASAAGKTARDNSSTADR